MIGPKGTIGDWLVYLVVEQIDPNADHPINQVIACSILANVGGYFQARK